MKRDDITTRQAEKLYAALVPTLGFLNQLEERFGELGFPSEDEYVAKLKAARDAFRMLTSETLRMTGSERVGRPNAS